MTIPPRRRPPIWFTIIIVVMLIPIIAWPVVIINHDPENTGNWWIINIFPIYALLSSYISYKCYLDRREISYILISIQLLSYLAVGFII